MATTPNPAPTQSVAATIGQDFLKFLPIFEGLANIGLIAASASGAIPAGSVALASTIEGGVNPLIQAIQQGSAKTTDAFIALSGIITTLNVLKAEIKDPATLAKIDECLASAQAGLQGWITAGQGFNPANYTPVTPV
ncbi:MAG: hypothetical protein KGL39_47405 [Patescibacteria group bacterium]|nr:hypothetical protein [Patescibacteria group bacterium]